MDCNVRTRMYSMCWAPVDSASPSPLCMRRVLMTTRVVLGKPASSAASLTWHMVALVLESCGSAAPSLLGLRLALALAQQLVRHTNPPRALMLTCGALMSGGAAADVSHG